MDGRAAALRGGRDRGAPVPAGACRHPDRGGARVLLEHGVDCGDGRGAVDADSELLRQMLAVQSSDDLLWIRHGYWDAPTGLLSAEGEARSW